MKLLFILLMFLSNLSYAQKSGSDFSTIDFKVRDIEATNLDSLAIRLSTPFHTDLEKVRAIFSWITEHISYKTSGRFRSLIPVRKVNYEPTEDTSALKPLNVRVAEQVLLRREAVCDGYSRLFQALCEASGIRCEVILGFARGDSRGVIKFRSNHSWNAVFVDSNWHLVDVTWASGYINFDGAFVKHFDDSYFFTSPQQFVYDHFPEDLTWTLLQDPPTLREFNQSPFKASAYLKHRIVSYKPLDGIIEAAPGEKLVFEVETLEQGKDQLVVASGTLPDSLIISTLWLSGKPVSTINGNKLMYTYTVEDASEKWLHIIYKGDIIMRYKLRIKKETAAR